MKMLIPNYIRFGHIRIYEMTKCINRLEIFILKIPLVLELVLDISDYQHHRLESKLINLRFSSVIIGQ